MGGSVGFYEKIFLISVMRHSNTKQNLFYDITKRS